MTTCRKKLALSTFIGKQLVLEIKVPPFSNKFNFVVVYVFRAHKSIYTAIMIFLELMLDLFYYKKRGQHTHKLMHIFLDILRKMLQVCTLKLPSYN